MKTKMYLRTLLLLPFSLSTAYIFPPNGDPRLTVINVYSGLEGIDGTPKQNNKEKIDIKIKLPRTNYARNILDFFKNDGNTPVNYNVVYPKTWAKDNAIELQVPQTTKRVDVRRKKNLSKIKPGFKPKKSYESFENVLDNSRSQKFDSSEEILNSTEDTDVYFKNNYNKNDLDQINNDINNDLEDSFEDSNNNLSTEVMGDIGDNYDELPSEFIKGPAGNIWPKKYNWNSYRRIIEVLKKIRH